MNNLRAGSAARVGIIAAVVGGGVILGAGSASAADVQYAAIAVSPSTGASSAVWNRASAEEAKADATASCNTEVPPVYHPPTGSSGGYTSGNDCAWQVQISSGWCAALVQSDDDGTNVYSSGWGNSRWEADYNAIQKGTGYGSLIINSVCQD